MKSAFIVGGFLASVALAQPHGHGHGHAHMHAHKHVARDKADSTACATEYVTETVIEWIDGTSTSYETDTPTPAPKPTSKDAEFHESQSPTPAAAQVPATTPPAPVPETPTSTYVPPPPPPATSTAAQVQVQAQPTPAAAQAAPAADSGSSSGSGTAGTASTPFSGDITYYTVGLGACGWDQTGMDNTKPIVALSHLYMGAASNGNPYCGKTITISHGGKTCQAVVSDKCMGCAEHDIDVSQVVFETLFDLGVGRATVDWWLN